MVTANASNTSTTLHRDQTERNTFRVWKEVARDIGTAQSKNSAQNIFEHYFLIEPHQYLVKPIFHTPSLFWLKLHFLPSVVTRYIIISTIKNQIAIDSKNSEGVIHVCM